MITKAIVKDGGLFIPDVGKVFSYKDRKEVRVQIEILPASDDEIYEKAAGLLKGKNIDPMNFQQEARDGWRK